MLDPFHQTSAVMGVDYANEKAPAGSAPSRGQLYEVLTGKRLQLLAELRDVEQALEALELSPQLDQVFTKVSKLLRRLA